MTCRHPAPPRPIDVTPCCKRESTPEFILAPLDAVSVFFRSRSDLALAILALWQRVAVLKRNQPRPKLSPFARLVWTILRRIWPRWADFFVIVKPETVIGEARSRHHTFGELPIAPGSLDVTPAL